MHGRQSAFKLVWVTGNLRASLRINIMLKAGIRGTRLDGADGAQANLPDCV